MSRAIPEFHLRPIAMAYLLGCLGATSTYAQTSGSTLPQVEVRSGQNNAFTSNNIQVGTFRDQDPLDVPLTNQAITREVIDAQGSTTLYGALLELAAKAREDGNALSLWKRRGKRDNKPTQRPEGSCAKANKATRRKLRGKRNNYPAQATRGKRHAKPTRRTQQ